ncbi:MAG TPA: 2'-5' RNA ligase family protein [Vicinamibacterales bacterium]|nr:2'-5' RNA ligase family protein [Vicinamibacterales bacterium]
MTIALDVALLLPAEASALAVGLNRRLAGGRPDGLTLDETHLPHVTLVQLFANQDRLAELYRRVEEAAGVAPLDLRVRGLDEESGTVMLVFEPNEPLRRLHEALMGAVQEFEVAGSVEAFCSRPPGGNWPSGPGSDDRPPRERDVNWVATYRDEHALANFLPHVTVGHGTGAGPVEPFSFRADRLAVCHLGRFCTCRVILHERRLAG